MKKRTDIDWSKHELTEIKEDHSLIHIIKIPGSSNNHVKFINSCGVMAVTGDFGNWIFCREFHPSEEGQVSDGYWLEKLQIASTQEPKKYSPEDTKTALLEALAEADTEDCPYTKVDEYKEYLEGCIENVDNEIEYLHYAYYEAPSFMDFEGMIVRKVTPYWLYAVFDAFEEICLRLKNKS